MTSYTLQVQPRASYTIEYANQRGPQGPTGPAGTGLTAIASGTILGNGLGDTALPQALNAVGVRTILGLATFDSPTFVGLTLTGLQQFSGTTTVGLRLKSLTTAEYNALTAANGDLFRDSTTDRIDARLARGTVELIDSAGGQVVGGNLAATTIMLGGASGPLLRNNAGTIEVRNNANSALANMSASQFTASFFRDSTNQANYFGAGIHARNTWILAYSSDGTDFGTKDLSFSRNAAGVGQLGNGTANASGSLLLTNLTASGTVTAGTYTVGTLPSAASNTRARAFVTDSNLAFNSTNLGATVTAGGSTLVPVFSNGTNWVIG